MAKLEQFVLRIWGHSDTVTGSLTILTLIFTVMVAILALMIPSQKLFFICVWLMCGIIQATGVIWAILIRKKVETQFVHDISFLERTLNNILIEKFDLSAVSKEPNAQLSDLFECLARAFDRGMNKYDKEYWDEVEALSTAIRQHGLTDHVYGEIRPGPKVERLARLAKNLFDAFMAE